MMKFIICLLLLIAFPVEAAQQICGMRDVMAANLKAKYQESLVSAGATDTGLIVETFAAKSGTFTVILTRPNGISCLVASGNKWWTAQPDKGPNT